MKNKLFKLICWVYSTIIKYFKATIFTLAATSLIITIGWKIWDQHLTELKDQVSSAPASKVLTKIYENIVRVSEVSNRIPPISMYAGMDSSLTVNAFTTGQGIYFTYAADLILNEDEKALVMGHEIAHVILHHTDNEYETFVNNYPNEDELMADNVGASWAHKAGYDVCKGRELFKKFYLWNGNSLNAIHPPNTLRYENLAHYCKGDK